MFDPSQSCEPSEKSTLVQPPKGWLELSRFSYPHMQGPAQMPDEAYVEDVDIDFNLLHSYFLNAGIPRVAANVWSTTAQSCMCSAPI